MLRIIFEIKIWVCQLKAGQHFADERTNDLEENFKWKMNQELSLKYFVKKYHIVIFYIVIAEEI